MQNYGLKLKTALPSEQTNMMKKEKKWQDNYGAFTMTTKCAVFMIKYNRNLTHILKW